MKLGSNVALAVALLLVGCGDGAAPGDASAALDLPPSFPADGPPFDWATPDADQDAAIRNAADHPAGEADVPVDVSPAETPTVDSPALDRDGPSQDAPVAPAECRVGPVPETPYRVQFEVHNFRSNNAPGLSVAEHCSPPTRYVEITSCASGYREQLGNVLGCRCACPFDTGCVERSPCVPCANTLFRPFPSGWTVSTWIAAKSRVDGPGGPTCDKWIPLPAGLYRITLKVRVGGQERLVSQNFELPAPGNRVRIDIEDHVHLDAGTAPEAGM